MMMSLKLCRMMMSLKLCRMMMSLKLCRMMMSLKLCRMMMSLKNEIRFWKPSKFSIFSYIVRKEQNDVHRFLVRITLITLSEKFIELILKDNYNVFLPSNFNQEWWLYCAGQKCGPSFQCTHKVSTLLESISVSGRPSVYTITLHNYNRLS